MSQIVSGNAGVAAGRVRRAGWAVLSQALAAEHHLHVGEAFTLPPHDRSGCASPRSTTNLGLAAGAIMMNATDYAQGMGERRPERVRDPDDPGRVGSRGPR